MIIISPTEEEKLPDAPGVYSFFLLLASRQRVGLIGQAPYQPQALLEARIALRRRLQRVQQVIAAKSLHGFVREQKGPDVADSYTVLLTQQPITELEELVAKSSDEFLPSLVDSLERVSMMAGPIYCGMARNQTLAQRYRQHKSEFYRAADNESFACRLARSKLTWDDVIFACSPLSVGGRDIRTIERLMHVMLKAPLSYQ